MKIKTWLKNKYWLWGVLFGWFLLWLVSPVSYIVGWRYTFSWKEFFSTFTNPLYFLKDIFFIGVLIFCALGFEIIFRSFKWYRKSALNTYSRLISLTIFILSTILFSMIVIIGFLTLLMGATT